MAFPADLILECSDCDLRRGCHAPVPGIGPAPARVLLLGEAPGYQEDLAGRPFCGPAGRYLDSLLFQAGVPRDSVYITNCCRCRPPNNTTPRAMHVGACAKWLDLELAVVRPELIVAMGATAIGRILGPGVGTVEHLHGHPMALDERVVLPTYHPAAALRNTTLLRQCQEDFQVLRGLVKGADWRAYVARDVCPDTNYQVADTPESVSRMRTDLSMADAVAVDAEVCRDRLWSVQLSACPGAAWFVPVAGDSGLARTADGRLSLLDLADIQGMIVVHNYLYDVRWLAIPDGGFVDTMTMAYLLGLPQGLKELASRLCGIPMLSYAEVVRPQQRVLSLRYLRGVLCRDWPDPPVQDETKWDNKHGGIVTRAKHPWHISRKVSSMLSDYDQNTDVDLWARWHSVPCEERAVVERVLGSMPESVLSDAPLDSAVRYACRDADATLRVYLKLRGLVAQMGLDVALNIDLDTLPMVNAMMQCGMAVDLQHLKSLSENIGVRMGVKAAELAAQVGHSFNPNSRPQVATVIYDELGFTPTAFTATREISTDDQELKRTRHPVAKGIIQYRGMLKVKGTYADALRGWATPDADGVPRVHTTLRTTRVETGRLSSAEPNLQNIPVRTDLGKQVRRGFIVPAGWLLFEGDYAQIELRTQAHLAKCKGLIDLFLRGGDPHTETAARLFGVSLDEAAEDKYRYPCKRAGFGIIYLIGSRGLSDQIQEYIADLEMDGTPVDIEPWDVPTCERFIADYYRLYPEIRVYQMEQVAHARRHGYVKDMFGRIRYIPEVSCPIRSVQDAGARQAANMPVTASAQGIIKSAMGALWRDLPQTEWLDKARWLMQIHDSLVIEVVDDEAVWRPFLRWLRDVMCGIVSLLVPVEADFKVGQNWGDMEKVKGDRANV